MVSRGLHLAIENHHLEALRARPQAEELFEFVGELEDEFFQSGFDAETDKAWGLIHQVLIGGNPCSDLLEPNGPSPLSHVIMGEEALTESDWYMVTLTSAPTVPVVNEVLQPITRVEFEARLRSLAQQHGCAGIAEEDVEYAGYWFDNMKKVFQAATSHNRHVIFTVDY